MVAVVAVAGLVAMSVMSLLGVSEYLTFAVVMALMIVILVGSYLAVLMPQKGREEREARATRFKAGLLTGSGLFRALPRSNEARTAGCWSAANLCAVQTVVCSKVNHLLTRAFFDPIGVCDRSSRNLGCRCMAF